VGYEEKLRERSNQLQAQLAGVAHSLKGLVAESDQFLDRYEVARSFPVSLAFEEARFLPRAPVEDALSDTHVLGRRTANTPSEGFALGRYERRLLDMLALLREAMVTYYERFKHGNLYRRDVNLRRLRETLDNIRRVQRRLNATGYWNFLLA